jgi:cytochrome c-type biogenesis protein CcmH
MRRFARSVAAISLLALAALPAPVPAVQPDEILQDARLEGEARRISSELRCLVCQNQSIDDSDAPLARDLRILVRERLKAGDDRDQVIDYVVARYGEFVLLNPRFSSRTYLLWFAPLLLLAAGLYLAYRLFDRGNTPLATAPPPLDAEEAAKLKRILGEPG